MSRKTINVEDFKNQCNKMLAMSEYDSKDIRYGIIEALESALRMSGNYNGFQYLESKDVPSGKKPGIRSYDKSYSENFKDTDDTRRKYF